jgi:hypothetical protein
MEKRSRLLAELDEARFKQFHEKEENFARAADVERQEFQRIILEQKATEEKERMINDQKKRAFNHHKEDVTHQI